MTVKHAGSPQPARLRRTTAVQKLTPKRIILRVSAPPARNPGSAKEQHTPDYPRQSSDFTPHDTPKTVFAATATQENPPRHGRPDDPPENMKTYEPIPILPRPGFRQ